MRFSTGLLLAGGLAALLTLLIAWPVVLHPTEQIYGHELLGRDAEPYAVIHQFATPGAPAAWTQPLTDRPGAMLASLMGPVAAYNLLVLLSFPLSAMSAYALARYLSGSHGAGLIAGLAFAFSPWHLAHAAYHPHLAQTQWLPLLVLALAALVDRLSLPRMIGLTVAAAATALASLYGALIAVVMAPVVLAAFWAIRPDADRNIRPFLFPVLLVAALTGGGALWVWLSPTPIVNPEFVLGTPDDVAFYRALWWAYFTPAIDHPWLGGLAAEVMENRGVSLQLVEVQLYIGYALVLLAFIGVALAAMRWKREPGWRSAAAAVFIGLVAAVVSLGPMSGSCDISAMAPACLLNRIAPAFTAYARFGGLAQLMVAIAAAVGAVALSRQSLSGRRVATVLLVVAAIEYLPLPARAHDVLPTTAHRWLASEPARGVTLDCLPWRSSDATVPWLMGRDVRFLDQTLESCGDPQLGLKLAGLQVQQVLVRKGRVASPLPTPLPAGLAPARSFADADLYTVAQTPPVIVTVATSGFFGYEHSDDDWWQWMSPSGTWTVRNTTSSPQEVSLSVRLQSVGAPRRLTVSVDGNTTGTVSVGLAVEDFTFGPWRLAPGDHVLSFSADGDPVRPADSDGGADRRPLTISFKNEHWNTAR